MSRGKRKAELKAKREERANSPNGIRNREYTKMANEGILGRQDLRK